jgi:hypothetical protein
MDTRRNGITPAELASEGSGLLAGLGIISMALFPLALPALIIALPLALPLIVVLPPALAIWLLARGVRRLVRHGRAGSARDQAEPRREPRRATALTGTG